MSNSIEALWSGLSRGARAAAAGVAAIALAGLMWGAFLLTREEYGVLFADLAQADAAAIVEQLKKDKVPYRLEGGGSTVKVPADHVHDVRLSLMAGDLPLSGGVGFEIFDKQGLGATEQSQRVSYQRALQGELVRTIGTIENVKQARVHLVMPESTLFSKDRREASAAVAIAMAPGVALDRNQIVGIQRLVAASVPGLDPARVVITDQRGVTMSASDAAHGAGAADARLQVKKEVEEYITHKVVRLLDSAFGPGQAIVSVDASLNFDATKTTVQDLLPTRASETPEGHVVRRRQVTGSSSNEPIWTSAADGAPAARTPSSSLEVEYQYGRRVEEVIAAPGALMRMSIGVIVPGALSEDKRARIAELVRMAAGIDEARGDAISVQPLSGLDAEARSASHFEDSVQLEAASGETPSRTSPPRDADRRLPLIIGAALIVAAALAALAYSMGVRRRASPLSEAERRALLEDIERSLGAESALARNRVRV